VKIIDKTKTTNLKYLRKNNPKYLVIHSTLKYPSFKKLLKFHKKKGWNGVGYHFFISKRSKIYLARPLNKEGAHSKGFNFESIGICIYRKNELPTRKNLEKLQILIETLRKKYRRIKIVSHSEMQLKFINKKLKKNFKFNPKKINKIKEDLEKIEIQDEKLKKVIKNFNNCPGNWFFELW
jgi:translation initiation factor 1 (eIF-1/SUI1)